MASELPAGWQPQGDYGNFGNYGQPPIESSQTPTPSAEAQSHYAKTGPSIDNTLYQSGF